MSNLKRIEINAHCVEQSPDYEVSYFDAKMANDAAAEARIEAQRSVKALRVYMKGQVTLQMHVKADWSEYRKLKREAKIITDQYIKQCKTRY